jgi:type II secretory pathway pseudopilin PulG
MLVVSGMILLLAGLLVAAGAELRKQALIKETRSRIKAIEAALEDYYATNRVYPTDGNTKLAEAVGDKIECTDAWGNQIYYDEIVASTYASQASSDPRGGSAKNGNYDIWSLGPDGQGGTEDTNEDNITNWERF